MKKVLSGLQKQVQEAIDRRTGWPKTSARRQTWVNSSPRAWATA